MASYLLGWALFYKCWSSRLLLCPVLWVHKISLHANFEAAEAARTRPHGRQSVGLTVLEAEISRSSDRPKIKILFLGRFDDLKISASSTVRPNLWRPCGRVRAASAASKFAWRLPRCINSNEQRSSLDLKHT